MKPAKIVKFQGRKYVMDREYLHIDEESYARADICYALVKDGKVWRHYRVIGDESEIEIIGDTVVELSAEGEMEVLEWGIGQDDPAIQSAAYLSLFLRSMLGGGDTQE